MGMDDNSDNVLWDVAACLWTLVGIGVLLLPFFLALWLNSPDSNAFREWAGMSQVTVKTVKPKTIPCKTLDDETGTKECKIKLDDGRTVTTVSARRMPPAFSHGEGSQCRFRSESRSRSSRSASVRQSPAVCGQSASSRANGWLFQ